MGMGRTVSPFLRNAAVTALLFGLFAEWMRPLAAMADLTEVHQVFPFLGAIGLYLLIDASGLRGAAAWPLKLLFTVGWIGYLYHPDAVASGAWWVQAVQIAAADYRLLAAGDVLSISPELRTALFLAGWSAIVFAVYRVIAERAQAVWFVAATLVFLALLQLWPGIETGYGLLRTAGIGLLLLLLLNAPKWEKTLGFSFAQGPLAAFARLGVGLICGLVVVGAGYLAARDEPREPVPVSVSFEVPSQWEQIASRFFGGTSGRAATGYGGGDSRLGAPMTLDDSVAFVAQSEVAAYWRGEAKDVYTGKGWRDSGISDQSQVFRSTEDGGRKVTQTVTVYNRNLEQTIFSGGTISKFLSLTDTEGAPVSDIHVRFDPDDDSYRVGTNTVRLKSYRMETVLPAVVSISATDPAASSVTRSVAAFTDASTSVSVSSAAVEDDSSRIGGASSGRYLQLPDTLPERVSALAREITAAVPEHPLQQAAAIQHYLHQHYSYTLETELPPPGADFVDHFLFESGKGYCNHFSTAMAVLLRSLGVETRWVKGFGPGDEDRDRPGTYIVRGSDAHSWVEVNVPGTGWVPFEATPGIGPNQAGAFDAAGMEAAMNMVVPGGIVLAGGAVALAERPAAVSAESLPARGAAEEVSFWQGAISEAAVWMSGIPPEWLVAAVGMALTGFVVSQVLSMLRRRSISVRRASPAERRLNAWWLRVHRLYGRRGPTETMREYTERQDFKSTEAKAAMMELVHYDEWVRYSGMTVRGAPQMWFEEVWRRLKNRR